ncbi:MAG: RNA polymerase sigma factor [Phycisphaeraceae bacterium]
MDQPDSDWQAWYDRHGPALLLFARQLTRTLAGAEDAMHDGFVRFWKRRGSVEDPTAYLYRAVRSAALDQRRSDGRREQREMRLLYDGRPTPPEPWHEAARDESEQQLREAIGKLPEAQRELVVLKVWGGLTFDQIAQATDTPRSTAAARYGAAIDALRQALPREAYGR